MEESCLLDFKNLKIGDKVHCTSNGEGFVKDVDLSLGEYVIRVYFDKINVYESYTEDFKLHTYSMHRSLYKTNPFVKAVKEVAKANALVKDLRTKIYHLNQENNDLYQDNLRLGRELDEKQVDYD